MHQREQEKLKEAFDFSAAELELNKGRELSDAQKARLESHLELRGCGRRAALITFALSAAIIFMIPLIFSGQPAIEQARPYIWWVAALFLLIVALSALVEYFSGRDMTTGKISVMEGTVHTDSKEIGTRNNKVGTAYYLMVDNRQFQLTTPQQTEALTGGADYRFYYIPNGRIPIILSVEWLRDPIDPI